MVRNSDDNICWNYETTPRTASIVGAASASFRFGRYEIGMKEWEIKTVKNKIVAGNTYASKEVTLYDGGREFEDIIHTFCPITAQAFLWILGKFTSGAGIADDTIEVLDSGEQYPITIRHEQLDGTNEKLRQWVGCLCNKLVFYMDRDTPLKVDPSFSFYDVEDVNDGANAILTTAPLIPGNDDATVAVDGKYVKFQVVYDPDGTPETLSYVDSFVGTISQSVSRGDDDDVQRVYKHTFKPHEILLMAVFEEDQRWDDFIDRDKADYQINIYKADDTNYIKIKLTNCRSRELKETKVKNGKYYISHLLLYGETMTVTINYTQEEGSGETVGTHFKGVVV